MQVFSGKIENRIEDVSASFYPYQINSNMENQMTTKSLSNTRSGSKICSIPNCGKSGKIRKSWCEMHYGRNRRYGSPFTVYVIAGEGNSPEKRFWSRVKKEANENGCWEWQGKRMLQGYARVGYKGAYILGHHLSWFLTYGIKPKFLLHSCDNPPCVNPSHLREGGHKENAQDRVARGRQQQGVGFSHAVLTDEKVREARRLYAEKMMIKDIAKLFGVAKTTISYAVNRKSWTHVK